MPTPPLPAVYASTMIAIAAHLRYLRRLNKRPGTIKQRGYALRRLTRHLHPRGILTATTDDLFDWIFDTRDLTPEAQCVELSHARGFYRWAVDETILTVDPTVTIRRPTVPRRLPRPMADGDLAMAIDMAPDRIRPWLLLAAYAGLRCHEIAPLAAEDLLRDTHPPVILVLDSKGGGTSVAPLSEHLERQLDRCGLPAVGHLFLRRDGEPGHVRPWLVSQLTNRYLHELGVKSTIHQARHWFGTHTLRIAGDVRVTQEALRHRSIVSTQRYTQIQPVQVSAAVNQLPTLSGSPSRFR